MQILPFAWTDATDARAPPACALSACLASLMPPVVSTLALLAFRGGRPPTPRSGVNFCPPREAETVADVATPALVVGTVAAAELEVDGPRSP